MSREGSPVHLWYDAAPMDAVKMKELLHPDVEFNVCAGWPNGGTFHGSRAVLEDFFPQSAKAWTTMSLAPEQIIESGDNYVVRGRYVGVARGTEMPFELEFVHIWRVQDNQLISLNQIADTAVLAAAMSGLPADE
jgi:ketosteroid isomerase-like protein